MFKNVDENNYKSPVEMFAILCSLQKFGPFT